MLDESLASRIAAERARRQRLITDQRMLAARVGSKSKRVSAPFHPVRVLMPCNAEPNPASPHASARDARLAAQREASHDTVRSFDGRTADEVDAAFTRLMAESTLPLEKQRGLTEVYNRDADARRRYSMLCEFSTYLRPRPSRVAVTC